MQDKKVTRHLQINPGSSNNMFKKIVFENQILIPI